MYFFAGLRSGVKATDLHENIVVKNEVGIHLGTVFLPDLVKDFLFVVLGPL